MGNKYYVNNGGAITSPNKFNNDNNKDGNLISSSTPIPSNSNADNAPPEQNRIEEIMMPQPSVFQVSLATQLEFYYMYSNKINQHHW